MTDDDFAIDMLIGIRVNIAYKYHEYKDYFAIFPDNMADDDTHNVLYVYLNADDEWVVYDYSGIASEYNDYVRGANMSERSFINHILDEFEDHTPKGECLALLYAQADYQPQNESDHILVQRFNAWPNSTIYEFIDGSILYVDDLSHHKEAYDDEDHFICDCDDDILPKKAATMLDGIVDVWENGKKPFSHKIRCEREALGKEVNSLIQAKRDQLKTMTV